ncbi:GDSL-like Lipase/Acylhydrolase [Colletotrichum scovillei]|uniref:GDSL-like Lipase/Acylhydrolase n=1 Tax=Colletotrichum scovillei TaxID=1209932 RepID=A0A9P7QS19_9PEZI|nr:GDSL-like Lipase/Acylhydrolase [Colletotrichum scovillei]KAF4774761.1 GDSL-like Lipase/Acylhydrolase [Colletotrichum scovillei]KAG7039604.1 GDSL-like Lipase/Acylhydrolase [Colletotrichum scovillei]KAG7041779.1 GDSL-like Lipase/Acylhydrolase [Colletotrichum scovillei]KAG7061810.1 GDSL-like Lipase/Acylhydrolase [Colletotrichum scovillei]
MMMLSRGVWIGFLATAYAAVLPSTQLPREVKTSSISSIVVFGDSFSDNGNGAARVSNNAWPTDKYYKGRFSNGIVWAEYVAANLSLPLYDYAVGGATTSNALIQGYTGAKGDIAVPSVIDQVVSFLARMNPQGGAFGASDSMAIESPLLILFAGANDILFNANISASQSYQILRQAEAQLRDAYPSARVLTLTPPDISRLPYGFYLEDNLGKNQLRTFTDQLGELLDRSKTGAVNVDLRPLFDDFEYYASPRAYGFDPLGKYGSCLEGAYGETPNVTICGDPDRRVYWDEYHPTTHTHSWIAKEVLDVLRGPF